MFTSSSARWLAALPALVALTAAAQTNSPTPTPTPSSASAEPAPSLSFHSAMEGYKPFAEEKPIPWQQANKTVYQRGGWRAYAKEASEGSKDEPAKAAPAEGVNPRAAHSMSMPMTEPAKEKP
ncbi:hypothetical protein SRS16CHR_04860 [Variovorax sp. SRS16]|uniref:hypothetical protein n=1 Tax=Variovorax sp. SRS16 TaxID=282217 RepID=UPI001317B411|nr:hypothetical protein [Variovorax sp. SRS16]VTU31345.1 hypothetical protein SRS16CHR_04860 [Variovorax sp. SRS16]